MKERITLLLIIAALLAFLIVFQNWFDTFWAFVFLIGFMAVYMFYSYLATKHRRRKLRKNPPEINPDYKPFISIMIPAHNEAQVIECSALNILKIDYENYELILIDDRSDDDTPKIIERLAKEHEKIKFLIRPKDAFPGKSAVLNDALKIAKGEAVLVFDADARVEPDFLKKMLINFEPANVGAIQARKNLLNPKQNFLTKCQYNEHVFDTHVQIGRDSVKGAVELRGNGELIKREAIESICGWNDETITDDLDMSTRLHIKGWDIRFCPDATVFEEGTVELGALLRQRRRWVEGSIRRYLELVGDVFSSGEISYRVGFDLVAYILQFILPFWLVAEVIIQAFRFVKGYEHTVLSSVALIIGVGIFFTISFTYSLRKYSHYNGLRAFWEGIVTSVYMMVFWIPIVLFIILKILFTNKTMDWGKTVHGVCDPASEAL